MPPSAAVISFSPLDRDARVRRQIRALIPICNVTAMGFSDPCIDEVKFVNLGPPTALARSKVSGFGEKLVRAWLLKTRCFEAAYRLHRPVRRATEILKEHNFALIVANDLDTLPLALTHRRGAKILYDAHEYTPKQYGARFLWRVFFQEYIWYLCRTRIKQPDAMTTVGPALAEEYARELGVRPAVVLNTPPHHAIPYVRRSGETIRIVHHGGTSRFRQLEITVDAMALLGERFRLDLMLVPNDPKYLEKLKRRAASDSRISFVPAVPPDEIVARISDYDVGACVLPPYSFNARYALPNKFFDFLQGRLCVAIGPSPEMERIVNRYSCGVVARDFTAADFAEKLDKLDRQQVEVFRRASDVAAWDLCYERSVEVIQEMVRDLQGLRSRSTSKE